MNPCKQIILILMATLTFTMPGHGASPEADVKQVVDTFYQQYYRDFVIKERKGSFDSQLIKWVDANPATSPRFKKGLAKAIRDARKDNPELGLDGDPILDGQDHPDKGYRAKSIKITKDRAAVTMEGIDHAKDFHISLELVNDKGHWLIDRIADIPPAGK